MSLRIADPLRGAAFLVRWLLMRRWRIGFLSRCDPPLMAAHPLMAVQQRD